MLTAIEVRNAKPKEKPYKLTDGGGLFLYIAPTGRKSWRFRYRFAGSESVMVLGEYPDTGLEAAREKRGDAKKLLKAGKNPTKERKAEKQAIIEAIEQEKTILENSFEMIAMEWHQHQDARWTPAHSNATLTILQRNIFPTIGALPVEQITPPMVLHILRNVEARGALEIAAKSLQRMNSVFRYAIQTGRATYNPAADMRGVLRAKKVQHHPMIELDELPAFLRTLTGGDIHITTKLAIQFTILTAARSGEVRGATWNEIDLSRKIWTVPAERMKMRSLHIVPLSEQAMAILNRAKVLYGDKGLVFPGIHYPERPLSENTMLFALYRIGYHSKATMHGFRALFSTIANESGFHPDAIERQLAHREKNAVRAAYHRAEYLPERTKIMEWWGKYLYHIENGAEIIPIGRQVAERSV
ncbi:integrase arm-type DNA-binding domain-containing protein [Desulfoprunum benzoelyticum]|nr:integrase arm-type DNA-binding domain-containing protein [Desulfoprunum benzoelyticum]